jgi:HAD superfamily hydrolase (TIGR01509 family)
MNDVKAIIFDCFGVLYPQAAGMFFQKYKDRFDRNPQTLDELNVQIDLGKISRAEFFAGLAGISGMSALAMQSEIDNQLIPDEQLITLIKLLKNTYRIGLLSNACKEEIEIIYRDKIDSVFDALAVSYEIGSVKPDPAIFRICAERLGVKPAECLFVDDSKGNLEGAARVGMKTLYYPTFGEVPRELEELLSPR